MTDIAGERPTSVTQQASGACPLCVDLDGTLVRTDTLWECLLLVVRRQPLTLWRVPVWLAQGKARLKRQLALRAVPAAELLPFKAPVLALIADARAQGRRVVLVSGADSQVAQAVAEYVGMFDEVIASDGTESLSGARKKRVLQERFGQGGFDYVGDCRADGPVWQEARTAYAAPGRRGLRAAREACRPEHIMLTSDRPGRALLHLLRPQQWVKNLLLFVPLMTSHQFTNLPLLGRELLLFVCFCLAASAGYIANDLLDIEADRRHPTKRNRPLAAGAIAIPSAMLAATSLLAGALALSGLLASWTVAGLVLLYVITSFGYSVRLKRLALVDVLTLAGLYALRVFAGAEAIDVVLSPWLLAFSVFMFLSLAFLKRYSELCIMRDQSRSDADGRGYSVDDLPLVRSYGTASGYMATMLFCLYISSPMASSLYARPALLWAAGPVLLYWVSRLWLLAGRRQMDDDPIAFAARDRVTYVCGALIALVAALAGPMG